ncbi:hypothetical protein Pyn_08528 [Prunus yedoensis var. nudiflora]|uniref:Uncharacterized protein n=1 Tax=Prunus yedoensis var. nudiflora TaxID=2094558 RepID=A0A314XJ43_PRUYE|nr:hypothetical protein Pyn_08528 [Prunus yedoensis var. nudiflora]
MGATRGDMMHYLALADIFVSTIVIVLRKLGAKNIEAGIGCGVDIGHGFGVGSILCDAGNSKARGSTSDSTTSSFGHGRCLFKDGPHIHPSNLLMTHYKDDEGPMSCLPRMESANEGYVGGAKAWGLSIS